ncbi:ankyrin repeat-containing domain protein [Hypoxylon sp. FL1150]|nr:ankyrin repeat-containing domain protein [Hypoxylon sp. FL1150]
MATEIRKLFDAIRRGDDAGVEELLASVGPNVQDESGLTPLHIAVQSQNYELVCSLLQADALPDTKSITGSTPLHHAARGRDVDIVEEILLYMGDDVDPKDNRGRTPLHEAAVEGSLTVAKYLLNYGADANAEDNDKNTPKLAGGIAELSIRECVKIDHPEIVARYMFHIIVNGNPVDDSVCTCDGVPDSNYILVQIALRSESAEQVLRNANLVINEDVSENTYLCRYRDVRQKVSLKEIRQLDPVVYADVYREELKVTPSLKTPPKSVIVDVSVHAGLDLTSKDLQARIAEKADVRLEEVFVAPHKIRLTVSGPRVGEIATIDEVRRIERVGIPIFSDNRETISSKTGRNTSSST